MLHSECGWREQVRRIRRRVLIGVGIVSLGSIPLLVFVLVGLPHVIRGPFVRNVVTGSGDHLAPAPQESRFSATFELFTGSRLEPGTTAEVLANGTIFPRLWSDLTEARRSITVQMYYAGPGRVVDSTVALLAQQARYGRDVYFLYDAFGSKPIPARLLDTLRSAGARVAEFRPLRWYALDRANHRSHVRGVVIDGRIAYTGGFGLDDKWLGTSHATDEWRETNVRFEGPAAVQLQGVFIAKWSEARGELRASDRLMPDVREAVVPAEGTGVQEAALLYSPPLTGSTTAERFLALSIAAARRRLYITNAYFIPEADFVSLLTAAARRHVDVRILTNGPQSDVESTRLAGHRQYAELLRAGVRIWEYRPTTIHAKTLVADGIWSAITTMNFDNRSLA